jgi:hypothetical protein
VNIESLSYGYSQKGKTIKVLQKELESLTSLKDSYTRVKDRKIQLLELCECFSREIVPHFIPQLANRDKQGAHHDSTMRQVADLKMVVISL